jgi:phosphatidylserine/phosphatidylglycerophosphate/cardiolipin synthase-like enzyme
MVSVLQRNWQSHLAKLLHSAERGILISSPYVTRQGVAFITENISSSVRTAGELNILTDLSPLNICQGATDPSALHSLVSVVPNVTLRHLPRLHAKVYIADRDRAIVTSGNLTAGGLALNYEYGVEISDQQTVEVIRHDITAYSNLGASVTNEQLVTYCQVADKVRTAFRKQQTSVAKSIRKEFARALRGAEDELVRLRLGGGAVHTVFAKTVLYLLSRHGPLSTEQLHNMMR